MFAVAESTSPITTDSSMDNGQRRIIHSSMVVTTGSSRDLSCSTAAVWDYYPYRGSQHITVYSGGKQSPDLDARFRLDLAGCQVNRCSLRIESVHLTDSGRFVCFQSDSTNYLSLVVLGQYDTAGLV